MLQHILKIIWKQRGRNGLMLLELFMSFLILVGVSSFLIYNITLLSTPLGFETRDRLMVLFYDNSDQDSIVYEAKVDQLITRLKEIPEIESISFGNSIYPFSRSLWTSMIEINNVKIRFLTASMDENYAATMGLNLTAGRWLQKPLSKEDIREIVVNQSFVDANFKGAEILDSVINMNGSSRVVGIIDHYKYNGLFVEEEPMSISYMDPYDFNSAQCIYLKMASDTPASLEQQIQKAVKESMQISDFVIKNLEEDRVASGKDNWLTILAISALAIFLIINVAMGLFGVLWYNIQQRKYEISLRKAMGASEGNILLQIIAESMGMVLIAMIFGGLIVGQIAYFGLIKEFSNDLILKGLVFTILFMGSLVLVCAVYPAWKASRQSPSIGLQEE
jgi:putative ABC transport system permease protein